MLKILNWLAVTLPVWLLCSRQKQPLRRLVSGGAVYFLHTSITPQTWILTHNKYSTTWLHQGTTALLLFCIKKSSMSLAWECFDIVRLFRLVERLWYCGWRFYKQLKLLENILPPMNLLRIAETVFPILSAIMTKSIILLRQPDDKCVQEKTRNWWEALPAARLAKLRRTPNLQGDICYVRFAYFLRHRQKTHPRFISTSCNPCQMVCSTLTVNINQFASVYLSI